MNPQLLSAVAINRYIKSSSSQRLYIERLERRVEILRPFLTQRIHVADALDAGVPVWQYRRADSELRQTWLDFCYGVLP